MSRFTVRKLSDEERGGTSPSGRFAVRKLEQALPGGSRGAVAPLPNLSLQAAKAGLQTGSTPISGAAVDRFFPSAVPSLRDEDALWAEVRTRSGSPAPLPTARPSAGLMLPTGAALQQERAKPRKLATLSSTFDVGPAGGQDNSTAFDIDPATVGTRAEYVPGPTGLARFGLGLKSIGQGIAGTPGVVYETGKQMAADTAENQANRRSARTDARAQEIRDELSRLAGQMDYIERYKYPTRKAGRSSQEYQELMAQRERLLDELGTAPVRTPVDMSAPGMKLYGEAIKTREEALEGLTGADRWLGEQAISIGQNLALLPTAAIHPAIPLSAMGAMAGADKMYELSQRGEPADEAFARGVVSGAIEAATEKIPLDTLMDVVKTGGRSALKNLLKQAGVEAGEESLSYVMNYIADKAARDPNASFSLAELANSAAGGAFSGFVLGGLGTAANRFQTLPMFDRRKVGTFPEVQKPTVEPLPDVGGPVAPSAAQDGANVQSGTVDTPAPQQAQKTASTGEAGNNTRLTETDIQAYLNTGKTGHTRNKKARLLESGKSPILTTAKAVKDFILSAIGGKSSGEVRGYGKVGTRFADAVRGVDSTVDIDGYYLELDADSLRHAYLQHSDAKQAGDISLSKQDFLNIPDYVDNFDYVLAVENYRGKQKIRLAKKINGYSVILETVSGERNSLQVLNMIGMSTEKFMDKYKNQIRGAGSQGGASAQTVNTTSLHTDSTSNSAPIIADSSAGGNTQSAQAGPESSTGGFGPNTVGSAENPFKSAPKISKVETNTFENGGIYNEVNKQMAGVKPEDLTYDPVSERQSMSHALDRLVNDFEGEKADLPNKEAWSGEDLDTAMGILYQARQQGKKTGDYSEFNRWRKLIQEKGTNAGQMIQAFAKYTRTPEGILMDAAETLERTGLDEARRNAILGDVETQVGALERIGEGDLDGLIELIERNSEIRGTTGLFSRKTASQMDWALREVAKSYSDAEAFLRDVAVSQLRSIAADYLPVSPLEAVKNFRVMGMLSKASTVMRNLVSNNVFDPLETLSNDIGVPLDIALSKLTGQRTTAVDKSWFSKAKRQGSLEGLLKSYIQVGLDASTENARGRYEGTAGRTFKMTGNLFERLLSTWAKYEGYALNTTDEFQKGGIRAEAQRGIDELKSAGKLDAKALPTWADETALQRTFQNDGRVARVMTGLRAAGNQLALKDSRGGSFGAGDLMLPFARVPGNLVSQAANYSPMGLINGMKDVVRTVYQAKKGQLSPEMQAQAVRNVGRGFTGSVALAGFGALALAGLINVAGADDKDKEALERAQGKNGTQWNLSATMRWLNGKGTEWRDGDTLVSIGFLEPLNAIMAAGALMADAYREDGALSLRDIVMSSASATFQAVLDLPAMSSIGSLIDAYTYAEGDTTAEKAADAAISYGGSQASSFLLPNFVKGIATGLDDTVRSQYGSGTTLGTARDSIVAGLPMFRKDLPASVDGFGRERTNTGNTALNLLNANLLPGQLRTYRQNAVEKELERISGSTGATNIYPGKNAPYTVRYDNQSYSLTPKERDAYQRSRGQATLRLMESLVGARSYQRASDQEKAEMLADAVSFGEDVAKREMLTARGVEYKSRAWEKAYAITRNGIDFGVYLEYKDLLAERKAAGKASAANAAVRKTLFSDGRLTQNQKEFLDQTLLSDNIVIPRNLDVKYADEETFAISQMSDGARKRWPGVKKRFPDITPEQYAQAWSIYNKDSKDMSAADKKAALRELVGEQGNALYSQLGKD
jgi:hypothetical protein